MKIRNHGQTKGGNRKAVYVDWGDKEDQEDLKKGCHVRQDAENK